MNVDVFIYHKLDGGIWGVFTIGHFQPSAVLDIFNEKLAQEGLHAVPKEFITHSYAVKVLGVDSNNYNTFIVDDSVPEAKEITWIDGELL